MRRVRRDPSFGKYRVLFLICNTWNRVLRAAEFMGSLQIFNEGGWEQDASPNIDAACQKHLKLKACIICTFTGSIPLAKVASPHEFQHAALVASKP